MRLRFLLTSLLLFTVGCGAGESGREVTLWHQMRPEDRAILVERIARFEKENPEIRIRELYKETEELRSGVESAVLVGKGPDLVYGPSDAIGVFQAIGGLQDMSPWISAETESKFDPRAVIRLPAYADPDREELVFLGDRFGNHLALVYNRNFVKQPPKTTDELVEIASANTIDEDGDGKPERYGLVWNYTEPFFVVPFLTGYGAWVFDDSGDPVPALDTPASIAAYQFVQDLKLKHRTLPRSADYEAAAALFRSGKAAMIIDGDWSWQKYIENEALDAAVATLPVVSSTGKPMAPMISPKGYSLTVVASEQRADDAMTALKFLTSADTQRVFLKEQRILPSRRAVRKDPLIEADPTLRVSVRQVENGCLMPINPELRSIWDSMRPSYQALMAGTMIPEAAAQQMQKTARIKIDQMQHPAEPDGTVRIVQVLGVVVVLGLLVWLVRGFVQFAGDWRRNRFAYAMAIPAFALILLTIVFPFVYNVVLSFSNMSLPRFRHWEIVGLHNYTTLLRGESGRTFWVVFGKTVLWTGINVFFHVVIGVFLAVVINGPIRGKSIYRVLLIIPWAVPAYITALTWRGMFDGEFGAVNHLAAWVNGWLPTFLQLPLLDWLKTPVPAFSACIITNVWLGVPFMLVIALGGLQGVPGELYEAARIDRATRWQQFWHITAPLLKPVLVPAITLGTIWTFNNLNVIWLVSNGGEPSDKTHILVSYVYKAVFNQYLYGYGAALSMVIFFILLAFSLVFLGRTKATEAVY